MCVYKTIKQIAKTITIPLSSEHEDMTKITSVHGSLLSSYDVTLKNV